MATELRWRVYYDNDSIFDSSQGSPLEAPGWGVVACNTFDPKEGRTFQSQSDFYVYEPECGWVGVDLIGLLDRLGNRIPMLSVCFGRTVPSDTYERIYLRAFRDPDFPLKSGRRVGEK